MVWCAILRETFRDKPADFDPRTSTPRDAALPYIPAEPYPFEAPYTAEEMGYRAAEFARRHWQVLAASAVTVLLLLGTAEGVKKFNKNR